MKPAELSFAEAAAAPTVLCTAHTGLAIGKQCSRILVHGASGGVGACVIQLARRRGCEVVGTCSAGNAQYVQGLGARALDYTTDWAAVLSREEERFDLVLDCVGGDDLWHSSCPLLASGGRFVTAVGPIRHGGSEPVTYSTMLWTAQLLCRRLLMNAVRAVEYRIFLGFERTALSRDPSLVKLLAEGGIRVRCDPKVFGLEELAEAHARCQGGSNTTGKLCVSVSRVDFLRADSFATALGKTA
uniref:Enoyl reductase (ER) domain-containing protein n=1 Tax=Calcidiscus leptoporus TaxID=127549 RepID=A0A7S0JHU4_9EUKA